MDEDDVVSRGGSDPDSYPPEEGLEKIRKKHPRHDGTKTWMSAKSVRPAGRVWWDGG